MNVVQPDSQPEADGRTMTEASPSYRLGMSPRSWALKRALALLAAGPRRPPSWLARPSARRAHRLASSFRTSACAWATPGSC